MIAAVIGVGAAWLAIAIPVAVVICRVISRRELQRPAPQLHVVRDAS